jgi:hypothetical protein
MKRSKTQWHERELDQDSVFYDWCHGKKLWKGVIEKTAHCD